MSKACFLLLLFNINVLKSRLFSSFKNNNFLFIYFIIVFIISKDLIFNYDVFVDINAFDNKIIIFHINFELFENIKNFVFINIEINVKLFIDIFYKFKYYLMIRANVNIRYKIKNVEIK